MSSLPGRRKEAAGLEPVFVSSMHILCELSTLGCGFGLLRNGEGHLLCLGSHRGQMSPGLCASPEVGAGRWRATRCVSRPLQGRLERGPGRVQKGITEPWELQPDNQEPLGGLKQSFDNGLTAWLRTFWSCSEGVGDAKHAGDSLPRSWRSGWMQVFVVPRCLAPALRSPSSQSWGFWVGGPRLYWVSQTNICQKQAAWGRCQTQVNVVFVPPKQCHASWAPECHSPVGRCGTGPR